MINVTQAAAGMIVLLLLSPAAKLAYLARREAWQI
jgi:hypothetical protein